MGRITFNSVNVLYVAYRRVSIHSDIIYVLRYHFILDLIHAVPVSPIHVLPHFSLDLRGAPTLTPPSSFYMLTAARGKDSFWFLSPSPNPHVSAQSFHFLMSPQRHNLYSVHCPTHVGLVLPCFFGFLLWVLLWATLLSSIAASPPLPPGPLRREPEWSYQNYQCSAVLWCNDFSF